jgi:HEAT repeat protein
MPDVHDTDGRRKRARTAAIALATIAAAAGIYIYRSPQMDGVRTRIVGMIRARGQFVGRDDRPKKTVEAVVREIEHGSESERAQAIALIRYDLTAADQARAWPHVIRAMKDQSPMVRTTAATLVADLNHVLAGDAPIAEQALAELLDDPAATLRAVAASSLGKIARIRQLDAPPPRLVACLEDGDQSVQSAASEALVEYRKGPELIVPVAMRRWRTETRAGKADLSFSDVFVFVRLEPSVLPLLIEGLSSEQADVRNLCTTAINHMGRDARPALPAILGLLRKELEASPASNLLALNIIAMAAGAIGELTPDAAPPAEAVEILCRVLQRGSEPQRDPSRDRAGPAVRSVTDSAVEAGRRYQMAEAIWSLGILGRASAPAVPLLLATFEALPESTPMPSDDLRGLTAEALAAIARGTPDEDRVRASLAKAWKTAPPKPKAAMTRALRSLGPKSDQLVSELARQPSDGTRSQIRPVRYPRSRHGFPVRE